MCELSFSPLVWWLCEGGFCSRTLFFCPLSSPWERAALCHRIICQRSCSGASSFSFKWNKRLHYSGCHLSRMDRLSLCQAAGLHTYQQICLLFALEDVSFQQSQSRALLYCANPKACARKHTRGSLTELKPQQCGMFSADLFDTDEPERYPSAPVKCWCTLPPNTSEVDLSMSTLHTSWDKCVYIASSAPQCTLTKWLLKHCPSPPLRLVNGQVMMCRRSDGRLPCQWPSVSVRPSLPACWAVSVHPLLHCHQH